MKDEWITFAVIDCNKRQIIALCGSARKAASFLTKGIRIEVWSGNVCVEKIYDGTRKSFKKYIERERVYIAKKQARAAQRNDSRRLRAALRA